MKIQIENKGSHAIPPAIIQVINICMAALHEVTDLEEAHERINEVMKSEPFFKCGKGGSHVWVSNWADERFLMITE